MNTLQVIKQIADASRDSRPVSLFMRGGGSFTFSPKEVRISHIAPMLPFSIKLDEELYGSVIKMVNADEVEPGLLLVIDTSGGHHPIDPSDVLIPTVMPKS